MLSKCTLCYWLLISSKTFIRDIKSVLGFLFISLPFPLFHIIWKYWIFKPKKHWHCLHVVFLRQLLFCALTDWSGKQNCWCATASVWGQRLTRITWRAAVPVCFGLNKGSVYMWISAMSVLPRCLATLYMKITKLFHKWI